MQTPYTEDYYLRGPEKGLSNYVNYSWQEEPTMALARRVLEVFGISEPMGVRFLDYGCARGYLVKALRRLGLGATGCDVSEWAIQNCDPEVAGYVTKQPAFDHYDHIWCKDVAEHMEPTELSKTLDWMLKAAQKSILFIVPLTSGRGDYPDWYIRKEDSQDTTHIIRWPLERWMEFVWGQGLISDWVLQGSWHIPGLKPTSLSHPKSCGFIMLTRI